MIYHCPRNELCKSQEIFSCASRSHYPKPFDGIYYSHFTLSTYAVLAVHTPIPSIACRPGKRHFCLPLIFIILCLRASARNIDPATPALILSEPGNRGMLMFIVRLHYKQRNTSFNEMLAQTQMSYSTKTHTYLKK